MREFHKEKIWDSLFSAARKLDLVDRYYQLVKSDVSINQVGKACTVYQVWLSFISGEREIQLAVVDYGEEVMLTFYLRNISNGSEVSLKDYLAEKEGRVKTDDLFRQERCSNEPELHRYLGCFFDRIKMIRSAGLDKLLVGESWVDLPFDWHGYK